MTFFVWADRLTDMFTVCLSIVYWLSAAFKEYHWTLYLHPLFISANHKGVSFLALFYRSKAYKASLLSLCMPVTGLLICHSHMLPVQVLMHSPTCILDMRYWCEATQPASKLLDLCWGLRVHFGLTHHAEGEAWAAGTPDAPPVPPVMDEWSSSDAHWAIHIQKLTLCH